MRISAFVEGVEELTEAYKCIMNCKHSQFIIKVEPDFHGKL